MKVLSVFTSLCMKSKRLAFPVDTKAMGFLLKKLFTCLSSRFF